ncbi:RagB/SusD family nutrient uptake outer membrane protein [Aureibaculum sp. 2210JD6-5]|uniref:RagB/SusD family nutrient uptake outer membrane protein n=1 Tax=Aureibaculum sp. 2210JD6-5 TaxID=3103957 RepID=UPI002AAEBC09|nr:RagB/SusD family nutrient uptake outer membrane protein [Aureibaculum sp. 2210JD6-5]MDY7396892.1 RagB/SusD family nutrient uptake outer membrane protein [Aureibaculum sp. 2210JD6-5]
MKNYRYKTIAKIIKCSLIVSLLLLTFSCDDGFLDEVPKDRLVPENAFKDTDGFKAAITHLHRSVREVYIQKDGPDMFFIFGLGSDFAGFGEGFNRASARMDYSVINSTDEPSSRWWSHFYGMIKNANVIINRAENSDVEWDTPTRKDEIIAEARFMRAYAYRSLAHLFGGVILIDKELAEVVTDRVRSTKTETYEFAVQDLIFAAANLPEVAEQDGRVTRAAANHLLSEVYLALEQWENAIDAATAVIDDPNYELMTSRFGTRASEPGDVYWDLFRTGNQNTGGGNKENIYSVQLEYQTPGGGDGTGAKGLHVERAWGARYHSLKDPNGESGFELTDLYGRPVGWCTTTPYLGYDIWDIDNDGIYDNDMRNSEYNIHRVDRGQFIYNRPASAFFGQSVDPSDVVTDTNVFNLFKTGVNVDPASIEKQAIRFWHPFFMKNTSPNNHPDGVINTGRIYRDQYVMRLAETYLLRAEAYLGNGNTSLAAADINVVRARANADPVDPSDVDINYILDERARELAMEEQRLLTLHRLGLQYERTKALNPWGAGTTIAPHNNLWPIPQKDIDLNTGAVIEQNPGY